MGETSIWEMKLRDEQWQILAPLLIGGRNDPGVCGKDNRLFIEAVLWVVFNNSAWCRVPPQFGVWNSTYMRFRRWNEINFWRHLAESKIADQELKLFLVQIADFADLYTDRIKQRKLRKKQKETYKKWIEMTENMSPYY